MENGDVRTICDCQERALRPRLWQCSASAFQSAIRQLRSGGIAALVGVPLAFVAIDMPREALNDGSVVALRLQAMEEQAFGIFSTGEARDGSTELPLAAGAITIEEAKEDLFRTAIPFGSIIYREAKKNQLDPELVAAVVRAESDFRVRLVSEKNAQGLMQIVPRTGRRLGAGDLLDPDENIAAGTRYLRYLVCRFGDPRVALAAYNAGEGNVEKWGGIPPFPETLAYLDRVNRHARDYRIRVRNAWTSRMENEPAKLR